MEKCKYYKLKYRKAKTNKIHKAVLQGYRSYASLEKLFVIICLCKELDSTKACREQDKLSTLGKNTEPGYLIDKGQT